MNLNEKAWTTRRRADKRSVIRRAGFLHRTAQIVPVPYDQATISRVHVPKKALAQFSIKT